MIQREIRFIRKLASVLVLIQLLTFQTVFAGDSSEKLSSGAVAALLPKLFKMHLQQHEMDTPFLRRVLKNYVGQLDPAKCFYLKNEAENLINISDEQLKTIGSQASAGDFSFFEKTFKDFVANQIARDAKFYESLDNRQEEIKSMSKDRSGLSLKVDGPVKNGTPEAQIEAAAKAAEDYDDDNEDLDKIKWGERPSNTTERETRIMKAVALLYRVNKSYLSEVESMKLGIQTVREERDRWLVPGAPEDVPKLFLKSFMDAMDPHTNYFDPEEDFSSGLERDFAGIGVQLRPCPLGAQVDEIIKGGPSEKSGQLAPGDQILAVDEFSLMGLPLTKIVHRIKGPKGTDVTLHVLKRSTRQKETVILKRDTIQLADIRVKGKKFDTPAGPVGLISVQNFYRDVHADVRDRLRELSKDKPLIGVILDLRDNHGGYLEEAVALTGLFIKSGPVVGERDGSGDVDWKRDNDGISYFNGPMVVLTNQFSASASEIVAGALKDYNRALIVAPTQTFGKGTVQRVISRGKLAPGEIKITTHQYFLPGGDSVQIKGVEPDVSIPGAKLLDEEGYLERASDNPIKFASISGALEKTNADVRAWTEWKEHSLGTIKDKSKMRIEANPNFKNSRHKPKNTEPAKPATPANPNEPPPLADHKEDKDPAADEAVNILQDMLPSWPGLDKQAAK